jgi:hypothetical protein
VCAGLSCLISLRAADWLMISDRPRIRQIQLEARSIGKPPALTS